MKNFKIWWIHKETWLWDSLCIKPTSPLNLLNLPKKLLDWWNATVIFKIVMHFFKLESPSPLFGENCCWVHENWCSSLLRRSYHIEVRVRRIHWLIAGRLGYVCKDLVGEMYSSRALDCGRAPLSQRSSLGGRKPCLMVHSLPRIAFCVIVGRVAIIRPYN